MKQIHYAASWVAHGLQQAGPYLLLELLLPGGSMMALMLWHCRHRHRRSE
jgi:hypothetical protein